MAVTSEYESVSAVMVAYSALDPLSGILRISAWVAREHSAPFLGRVDDLIARGSFRADVPREWLVAAFHALIYATGQEISDGRLDPAAATGVLEATLIGLFAGRSSTSRAGACRKRTPD